jgi:hypothetical protein
MTRTHARLALALTTVALLATSIGALQRGH